MNIKFDIRVWILIGSIKPLQIYMYSEYYLRFSSVEFDLSDLDNKFIHLTNNAVQCKNSSVDDRRVEENMWSRDQFVKYMGDLKREEERVQIEKRIQEIVYLSVISCYDQIDKRSKSFELFGYDFMVDQHFNVWLIEVNTSPSLGYSTQLTQRLVKDLLTDTLTIILKSNQSHKYILIKQDLKNKKPS